MGLLPCLRRGADRWWLPCSDEAKEVIGRLLVAGAQNTSIDSATRRLLLNTFRRDPPLLIFAVLSFADAGSSEGDGKSPTATLEQLADRFMVQVTPRFASGDSFLGAPEVTRELQQQWHKLRDYFRTIPLDRWIDEATFWLQVTGPPIQEDWKSQWPSLQLDDAELEADIQPELDSSSLLESLARLSLRYRSLETTFDDQLRQRKLDSLKELAYGLSHEINNPLANISTRAQQLQRGETDPSRNATLQRIVDQVYRAHEMIADLMFYANPPSASVTSCQLLDLLQSIAHSFHEELDRHSIRLEIAAPDGDVAARVDEKMIGEAVRVLLRNAIDAIGCQGTIVLSLVDQGPRTLIHVADSGPGVTDEARNHAFDPYFSGREAGRGLGLGLCRAYRIARLHDGEITLAGGPAGCVATLSLPATRRTGERHRSLAGNTTSKTGR